MKKKFPVKVLKKKLVGENSKFNIYFMHVVDNYKNEVPNYLVISPKLKTQNLVTGAAILPIKDGCIGLVSIFRPAINDYSWEIPHGFIDVGESNRESGQRELLEETGLYVEPHNFSSLGYLTPDAGVLQARMEVFLAKDCNVKRGIQHELGLMDFRFISFDAFYKMVLSSEVQDCVTLAAWARYSLHHFGVSA